MSEDILGDVLNMQMVLPGLAWSYAPVDSPLLQVVLFPHHRRFKATKEIRMMMIDQLECLPDSVEAAVADYRLKFGMPFLAWTRSGHSDSKR